MEYLSIRLFVLCIFWVRCLLVTFGPFFKKWSCVLIVESKISVCVLDNKSIIKCIFGKYFLTMCGLCFYSLDIVFGREDIFNFSKFGSLILFLMGCVSGVMFITPNVNSSRFSPIASRSFIVLCFKFRSVIHFKLIFAMGV